MATRFDFERREYVRVNCNLRVRYKFYYCYPQAETEEVCEGNTVNISAGGMLLKGPVPNLEWIPDLLMHKMIIAAKIFLPQDVEPVKVFARVAWMEAMQQGSRIWGMGLKFQEITAQDRERVTLFVIRTQLP